MFKAFRSYFIIFIKCGMRISLSVTIVVVMLVLLCITIVSVRALSVFYNAV